MFKTYLGLVPTTYFVLFRGNLDFLRKSVITALQFNTTINLFQIAYESGWDPIDSLEIPWALPVGLLLASFGWWESFVDENSFSPGLFKLQRAFLKWAIPGLFFFIFRLFYKKLKVNKCSIKVAVGWIRTQALWYWKQQLCQLRHNHCPSFNIFNLEPIA